MTDLPCRRGHTRWLSDCPHIPQIDKYARIGNHPIAKETALSIIDVAGQPPTLAGESSVPQQDN